MGYLLKKQLEVALRYTSINPDEEVSKNETEYTFGYQDILLDIN